MSTHQEEWTVLIRGAGEVASGIAHRLHRAGFRVVLTERDDPLAVCRGTAFSEAVFDGTKTIEGVTAEIVAASVEAVREAWHRGRIPLVMDPEASVRNAVQPDVLVDAMMAKRRTSTRITDAPLVIGVGPGLCAGNDVHLIVETANGPNTGAIIAEGEAEKNTRVPVEVGGLTSERVVWAPAGGVFKSSLAIGDAVSAGDIIGRIADVAVAAPISGMLRGTVRTGVTVAKGDKLIEVDPNYEPELCFFIRDKMRVIGAAVLEAINSRSGRDKAGREDTRC